MVCLFFGIGLGLKDGEAEELRREERGTGSRLGWDGW